MNNLASESGDTRFELSVIAEVRHEGPPVGPSWSEALLLSGDVRFGSSVVSVRWERDFQIPTRGVIRYAAKAKGSLDSIDAVRAMASAPLSELAAVWEGAAGPIPASVVEFRMKDALDLVCLEDGYTRIIEAKRFLMDNIPVRSEVFSLDGIWGSLVAMLKKDVIDRYGKFDVGQVLQTAKEAGVATEASVIRDRGHFLVIDEEP